MAITEIRHEKALDLLEVVFTGGRPTNADLVKTLTARRLFHFGRTVSAVSPSKGSPGIVRLARSAKISEVEHARCGLFHIVEMTYRAEHGEGTYTAYRIRPATPGVEMAYRKHRNKEAAILQATSLTVQNLLASDIRQIGVESVPCPSCGTGNSLAQDECAECATTLTVWGVDKPVLDGSATIPCECCGCSNNIQEESCPECGVLIQLFGVRRPR